MPFKPLAACLLLALLLTLPGCGGTEQPSPTPTATPATMDNPFEQEQTIGRLSIGPVEPYEDEEGNAVAIQYTGEELALDYEATGEGIAREFGVLLFLDGMPQPYHTDTEEELAYMHYFSIPQDGDTLPFQLCFTPVTGKAGDTFHLSVCGMDNAQFKPDMAETVSYGIRQQTQETLPYFELLADPPQAELPQTVAALANVTVSTQLLPGDGEDSNTGDSATTEVLYDGKPNYNSLDVTGKDTVHITYRLSGGPAGAVYRLMFFGDHQPLSDGTDRVWTVTVGRNEEVTVEADLQVDQLKENTTFYPLLAPTSEWFTLATKEQSILLYRTD